MHALSNNYMDGLRLFLFAAFMVSSTIAANKGTITIKINGHPLTKYVLCDEWTMKTAILSTTSITLKGGGHIYLGESSSGNFTINSFYQMSLLGKRLTFEADMSNVGCNCNGAFYLVQMPAYNSNQKPEPGKNGEYYCDANQVGGTYCPEMDVMEANKYAMASTAHTCNYVAPHYYSTCDRGGCGQNVLNVNASAFGPGKQINTNKPFTLSVSFVKGGDGKLTTITNEITQSGRQSVKFNACNPNYLQWMGYSLPGIVLTMSLWGTKDGGMSWLDGKSGCHGDCNLAGSSVTFSNIRIDDL